VHPKWTNGLKVDLYPLREGDELRQSAFNGGNKLIMAPDRESVHSLAEDLILYKLIYFGLSQQPKHSRDLAAVLRTKKDQLDFGYMEKWVHCFGLVSLWREILNNIS
jgi:hypothetical protein